MKAARASLRGQINPSPSPLTIRLQSPSTARSVHSPKSCFGGARMVHGGCTHITPPFKAALTMFSGA